jgi:hypothetical protein
MLHEIFETVGAVVSVKIVSVSDTDNAWKYMCKKRTNIYAMNRSEDTLPMYEINTILVYAKRH